MGHPAVPQIQDFNKRAGEDRSHLCLKLVEQIRDRFIAGIATAVGHGCLE